MFDFFKNEWKLFIEDLGNIRNFFQNVFGEGEQVLMLAQEEATEEVLEDVEEIVYENDSIDHNVVAYLGEDIDSLRNNMCGQTTQHQVVREYAQYFKPYSINQEMCNCAFKKYYDTHALEIASSEIPVQQLRILQNNADIFIEGQEEFGENSQFIDSRVDTVFSKVGQENVSEIVDILHDKSNESVNLQGERLLSEVIHYMVDNSIKVAADKDIISPTKLVLENKLNSVHSSLRNHEDWNEEYQQLLSAERKYLYALNRIEQYETEQKISEFEANLENVSLEI